MASEDLKSRARAKRYMRAERIDEANVRGLASKLKILHKIGLFKYNDLFYECGLDVELNSSAPTFLNKLTHWLNNANVPNAPGTRKPVFKLDFFDQRQYSKIVDHLFAANLWYPRELLSRKSDEAGSESDAYLMHHLFPDPAFHAVSYFIGMNRNPDGTTHTKDTVHLREKFTGGYNVYRFSTIELGNVLVGNLTIGWDGDTRSIVTSERYATVRPKREFDLDGYFFGYDQRYRLLSRRRDSRNPQVAYIDKIEPDQDGNVDLMTGVVFDYEDDGRLYSTRIVIVRALSAGEIEVPRTEPIGKIPVRARSRLEIKPQVSAEYIYFF